MLAIGLTALGATVGFALAFALGAGLIPTLLTAAAGGTIGYLAMKTWKLTGDMNSRSTELADQDVALQAQHDGQ